MSSDVRPIRNDRDHSAAIGEIERLWGTDPGTPDGDRLDVLATLVDAYEAANHPLDPPDPLDAIVFRLEQQGLTRRDLEPLIGGPARVDEVMARRRDLSIGMIRRLHESLGISADLLIRPTRRATA